MTQEIIKRDDNRKTALAGVTDDASLEIKNLRVDPTTKRLKVAATFSDAYVATLNATSSVFYPDTFLDGSVPPDTYELLTNTGQVEIRKFSGVADQDVNISWQPSYRISSGTVQFRVVMFITEATVPANGETIIFKLAGCAYADSDNLNKALGTAVGVTYTAPASGLAQYDKIASGWSTDVTITDLATLLPTRLNLLRDTANDTYAQKIGAAYLEVRYSNT